MLPPHITGGMGPVPLMLGINIHVSFVTTESISDEPTTGHDYVLYECTRVKVHHITVFFDQQRIPSLTQHTWCVPSDVCFVACSTPCALRTSHDHLPASLILCVLYAASPLSLFHLDCQPPLLVFGVLALDRCRCPTRSLFPLLLASFDVAHLNHATGCASSWWRQKNTLHRMA